MLGIDPGKKALFTAFCVDKNRLSSLFDDVIKVSSDIEMYENTVIENDSKRQKRRKNKRKKKKWKRVRNKRREREKEIKPIITVTNQPVPIDLTSEMECTFSYATKK